MVSIKSFYNLENVLRKNLTRYLTQFILCTLQSSTFLITLHLSISGVLFIKEVPLNKPLKIASNSVGWKSVTVIIMIIIYLIIIILKKKTKQIKNLILQDRNFPTGINKVFFIFISFILLLLVNIV